ncbi:branched-chain amino acid aminotransferase [Desulfobacter hydrogenophilus]|uniref:branched-chain-amino-acid transaminase n=1 Tax=Desulfobacter hydrogenophilus TaxID=2291 RepID=A0A328FDT3_9BACT|nr:aminotransferase class IV [Desulfobacter hydrogenophilus]NDY72517.1 branched-chain amino acid aminotransferase [Desulfobacter hydrogenophilus]QBH14152.1 branched-chain amino acid aminotransferase [Desulfobacter hydrogenophilus]RAM01592.1 branched-chain amino acid aminotransferase [Desulfobacter hydrogenophilus]
MKTVYVDGKFLPWDKAMIPVDDLAVLRGYAVCDIIRTIGGKPYCLDAHIDRLLSSATKIGLTPAWTKQEIKELVLKVIEKNTHMDEANIRILVTGGSSPDFFSPADNPRLIILATDIPALPAQWYTKGVKVITFFQQRVLPDAKATNYIPAVLALKKAKAQGAVEALYMTRDNMVLEGTTSNLFALVDGTLVTPENGVLKGITRKTVLALGEKLFPVSEQDLSLDTLLSASELFITGTNKGIVPVIQVNDHVIGTGLPGPGTRALIEAMKNQQGGTSNSSSVV